MLSTSQHLHVLQEAAERAVGQLHRGVEFPLGGVQHLPEGGHGLQVLPPPGLQLVRPGILQRGAERDTFSLFGREYGRKAARLFMSLSRRFLPPMSDTA